MDALVDTCQTSRQCNMAYMLHMTSHGYVSIKHNTEVESNGTRDNITVPNLNRSDAVSLMMAS